MNTREIIIDQFAQWIAFSSTRSGCPIKSRKDVYPLIKLPNYNQVLDGNINITNEEFNFWHKKNTEKINAHQPKLCIGWSAKLINLYLKVVVYVGKAGRPNLINYIHPPIDNGLWEGIKERFKEEKDIIKKTHSVNRISAIETYNQYMTIINGMKLLSKKVGCQLIEVEQYWEGTAY